jgi:hypothetical protein
MKMFDRLAEQASRAHEISFGVPFSEEEKKEFLKISRFEYLIDAVVYTAELAAARKLTEQEREMIKDHIDKEVIMFLEDHTVHELKGSGLAKKISMDIVKMFYISSREA